MISWTSVSADTAFLIAAVSMVAAILSRLVNSCITACTAKEKESQMKKITRAAAVAVENVLTMKGVSENEGNLHESQQLWKQQLSRRQYQHSQKSMKSCDTRHKSVVEKDQKITTSKMFGLKYPPKPLRLEDCYKKPKSSSICSDTQSEESKDDDIIVDPGWDDFCLTSAKLPRMEAHRLGKKTSRRNCPATKEGRRGSFKAYYRTREKGEKNRRSSAPNRALGKRSSKVSDYMSLVIAKSNPDYVEAKQATEEIEIPSIGFAVPSEFKEGTIKTLGAVIKQNNTILYLLVKQSEEVRSIREELTEVKGRDGTSTDDPPTQDDQVHDYQWAQRRRFELQRGFRRLRGQRYNNTLESMVNPKQQLTISGRRRAQLAPAEVLYSYHRQTARHRVYEHYSEQRINCGEGDQVDLRSSRNSYYVAPILMESYSGCNNEDSMRYEIDTPRRRESGVLWKRMSFASHRRGDIITYDVCFCKGCLEEEEDLKYEPLNDQKRSNKPKNKKRQKWSTLGEPNGKWDYYVRYNSTQSTIPIEEVAATGWGEEFEDEDTPTTKFMVYEQETTDSSESEWENPFAAKSGGNQESCFHLNEDEELPYPNNIYNPPNDLMMGPPVYPPATGNYQQYNESQFQPKSQKGFKGDYGNYHNQQWSLPPAYAGTGELLVLSRRSRVLDDFIQDGEEKLTVATMEDILYAEAYVIPDRYGDDPQIITSK
ncbi:hypothetical protein Tco_0514198 [Tanacetum coccineum]